MNGYIIPPCVSGFQATIIILLTIFLTIKWTIFLLKTWLKGVSWRKFEFWLYIVYTIIAGALGGTVIFYLTLLLVYFWWNLVLIAIIIAVIFVAQLLKKIFGKKKEDINN